MNFNLNAHASIDLHPGARLRLIWLGVAACLIPLAFYVKTLAPTVTLEDSGELITAARFLGVAHPPGYPLWCLIAHAFTWIPAGTIAQRVHLCSACFAAAACGIMFLTVWRLTRRDFAALAAALALGFSEILWSQAVIAEVYTLNAFLVLTAVYCVVRWREERRRFWFYALALTIGLGLANHHLMALLAPVWIVWALAPHWRDVLRLRVVLGALLLLAAGLAFYAYIPIRAKADPPLNWDNPHTLAKTIRHISRAGYQAPAEQVRYTGTSRDVVRLCWEGARQSVRAVTWPWVALAVAGAVIGWRRRRDIVWVALAVSLLNIVALNILLHVPASPRALFVFRVYYIPAQIMLFLLAAVGWTEVGARLKDRPRSWRCAAAVLGIVCVFWPLVAHYRLNDRSHYWQARDFGLDLLDSLPPRAGLLGVSDEAVFICCYLKWVEGLRPDIHLLDRSLGWRGESIAAVISEVPATPRLIAVYPVLKGSTSIPWGLGYRLVRADQFPGVDDAAFRPLPHPPRPVQISSNADPFESYLNALYAQYHARLGAKLLLAANRTGAQEQWALSESLKGNDAYSWFLLAAIYERYRVQPPGLIAFMRQQALKLYDREYDPADYRFYPITREELAAAVSSKL